MIEISKKILDELWTAGHVPDYGALGLIMRHVVPLEERVENLEDGLRKVANRLDEIASLIPSQLDPRLRQLDQVVASNLKATAAFCLNVLATSAKPAPVQDGDDAAPAQQPGPAGAFGREEGER